MSAAYPAYYTQNGRGGAVPSMEAGIGCSTLRVLYDRIVEKGNGGHFMRAIRNWVYRDSPVMNLKEGQARCCADALEPMERKRLPSQEELYIMSHSSVGEA